MENNFEYPTTPKNNGLKIAIISICSVLGFLLILFLLFQFLVGGPKKEKLVFEAGYEATIEKTDVLTGPAFLANMSSLDVGNFDPMKVGKYTITAKHGFRTYEITAVVKDTEAPIIEAPSTPSYVKVGEAISVLDLGATITDKGSNFTVSVNGSDSVTESEVGTYSYELTAVDDYNNSSTATVTVTFDTAPVISGAMDYYVIAGTNINYLDGVTSYDDVDGDLTSGLTFDDSNVNLSTEGDYYCTVSSTDQYGLCTEVEVLIKVTSADIIQNLINTHEINRNTQHIVGAYNLYDGGTFEGENLEAVIDYYHPAFVAVTGEHCRGSGFIAQITDSDIIVVTNNHVISMSGENQYYVEFYEGTRIPCTILGKTGVSLPHNDLGIVSLPISSVPDELFCQLMTVHVDNSYYETIPEDGSLTCGLFTVKDSLGLRGDKLYTGTFSRKYDSDSALTTGEATRYNINTITGTSGSAVIDCHGNLLAVNAFHTWSNVPGDSYRHTYGVPLAALLSFYQETIGTSLNYQ